MEIPVQAEYLVSRKIRLSMRSCDVERTKVVKSVSSVPRKAAIVYTVPVP